MTDTNDTDLADSESASAPSTGAASRSLSREEFRASSSSTEFPQQALALERGVDRRDFVKLMGASMALGRLAACNQPAEKIVPYVRQPENLIPGKPIFFATAMPLSGYAHGVLVESHMGRPTKIEGNPDHPSSLGATDAFMQASILGLYDPDRSQVVRHLGEISTWSEFLAALQPVLNARRRTARRAAPDADHHLADARRADPAAPGAVPGMKWHQWEPAGGDNVREGLRLAFGGYANAVYHFDKANVVVSLDSDFLERGPDTSATRATSASRRKVRKGDDVDQSPLRDRVQPDRHRLARRSPPGRAPSQIEAYARAIAGVGQAARRSRRLDRRARPRSAEEPRREHRHRRRRAAAGRPRHRHAINQALGNIGSTITITDPRRGRAGQSARFAASSSSPT